MTRLRFIFPAMFVILLAACSSSQPESEGGAAPSSDAIKVQVVNNSSSSADISFMFGANPKQRLGRVSAGGEGSFEFFFRGGDLRMVVDFSATRRTATSNGINDLRVGESLQLEIRRDGEPRLSRAGM